MAIHIEPDWIYGRSREEKEMWVGYIAADAGTISAPTKAEMTEVFTTPNIVFDDTNDEIDLEANSVYEIFVRVSQTGASSYVEIYNVTGAAQLAASPLAAGEKNLRHIVKTTTAISIAIRLDDQTANTITEAAGQVVVKRIGKVAS